VESEDEDPNPHVNPSSNMSSTAPVSFIEVFHHPHSHQHSSTRIFLDSAPVFTSTTISVEANAKPWAPFKTRADFEFTEQVVKKCMERDTVNILLKGYHGEWATATTLTLRGHRDVEASLAAARKFGIQVCLHVDGLIYSSLMPIFQFRDGEVNHSFCGRPYCFKFKYRDPWRWILDIVGDRTLAEDIMWFPVQRYLNDGIRITRIYDELNTGDAWWTIQVCRYYPSAK